MERKRKNLTFSNPYEFFKYYYTNVIRDERRIKFIDTIKPGQIVIIKNGKDESPFEHPDVKAYHDFLRYYWKPKTSYFSILMPCTEIKPYRLSTTHKMMLRYVTLLNDMGCKTSLYSISEPMIIVPYEFEEYYPLSNYEFPPKLMENWEKELMADLLSQVIPKIVRSTRYRIVALLPKHHMSILIRALEKIGDNNGCIKEKLLLLKYGRLAFRSLKNVYDILVEECKNRILLTK